jgi:hypothetical protein
VAACRRNQKYRARLDRRRHADRRPDCSRLNCRRWWQCRLSRRDPTSGRRRRPAHARQPRRQTRLRPLICRAGRHRRLPRPRGWIGQARRSPDPWGVGPGGRENRVALPVVTTSALGTSAMPDFNAAPTSAPRPSRYSAPVAITTRSKPMRTSGCVTTSAP